MSSGAELEFLTGTQKGEVYPLPFGRTVLGRVVGDLLIEDREVSSIHAIVSHERGGWYLMDLGSTNGVYVGGQLKLEARLRHGDRIRIGQSQLVFREQTSKVSEVLPVAIGSGEHTLPTMGSFEEDMGSVASFGPPLRLENSSRFNPGRDYETETLAIEDSQGISAAGGGSFTITLKVEEGPDIGLSFSSHSPVILIGRDNADLVLGDRNVSRRHALIEVYDDDQVFVRDLTSRNGTLVNGRTTTSARLKAGDRIKLGLTQIVFGFERLEDTTSG